MNGLPYVYTPRPGERVKVDRRGGGPDGTQVSVCGQGAGSVRILADEVPAAAAGIAAAMHEAAGLPAPVILDRPTPVGTALGYYAEGCKVFADGGKVRLQATRSPGTRDYWHARLELADARKLATYLAVVADALEGEPDPAEVGELAADILEAPDMRSELIARHLLRLGYKKQQRGEERHG